MFTEYRYLNFANKKHDLYVYFIQSYYYYYSSSGFSSMQCSLFTVLRFD